MRVQLGAIAIEHFQQNPFGGSPRGLPIRFDKLILRTLQKRSACRPRFCVRVCPLIPGRVVGRHGLKEVVVSSSTLPPHPKGLEVLGRVSPLNCHVVDARHLRPVVDRFC
jgi:hypothetical protein